MGKDEFPCDHYVLDMTASSFGACKCGWGKSDHGKGLGPSAPKAPPPPVAVDIAPQERRPCQNFFADVSASEFGMCTCGFKKSEHGRKSADPEHVQKIAEGLHPSIHSPKGSLASSATVFLAGTADHEAKTTAIMENKKGGPCAHFQVDIKSTTFGMCVCGFSSEDHKKAQKEASRTAMIDTITAAAAANNNNSTPGARSHGSGSAGSSSKACDNYTVDLAAKNFGDCVCGHSKAAHMKNHSKFANHAEEEEQVAPLPEIAPEVIIRDGTNCCSKFELDVANPNFDYCLCGFSRKDHQSRISVTPAEYKQIRATLTKPKEFT